MFCFAFCMMSPQDALTLHCFDCTTHNPPVLSADHDEVVTTYSQVAVQLIQRSGYQSQSFIFLKVERLKEIHGTVEPHYSKAPMDPLHSSIVTSSALLLILQVGELIGVGLHSGYAKQRIKMQEVVTVMMTVLLQQA
ncbi:uncharacterized protein LOC117643714 isoform X2 [Thrips palmi]|uniref:Uncharacterized protein LOC117643714 isoform X2 n=1 Tax=Thrips palmi TaxID=161013 RepID=A0A6P8YP63_THRPL|nr:uncharacterized protein LOC117643714 isoform X2 [Thrips palmi]